MQDARPFLPSQALRPRQLDCLFLQASLHFVDGFLLLANDINRELSSCIAGEMATAQRMNGTCVHAGASDWSRPWKLPVDRKLLPGYGTPRRALLIKYGRPGIFQTW